MHPRREETFPLALPDKGKVEAYWSFAAEPGDKAIVYVHGFGSTRGGEKSLALEKACAARGWTFVAFDFRGHGGSSGRMLDLRGTALLEDLEALKDHLEGKTTPL